MTSERTDDFRALREALHNVANGDTMGAYAASALAENLRRIEQSFVELTRQVPCPHYATPEPPKGRTSE